MGWELRALAAAAPPPGRGIARTGAGETRGVGAENQAASLEAARGLALSRCRRGAVARPLTGSGVTRLVSLLLLDAA